MKSENLLTNDLKMMKTKPPKKFSFYSTRMYIAILLAFGIFTGTTLRIDMSMAIVCMVNSSYSDSESIKSINNNDNLTTLLTTTELIKNTESKCGKLTQEEATESGYDGELQWTQKQIALLFSASFYGSLFTVWWSGWFADTFKPKTVFFCAVLNSVFWTFLTPTLAKTSFWAILVARFLMGLGEGFIMPCITSIGSNWFAPNERSTFAAIYTSGNQLGASLALPVASFLCSSTLGWTAIFYVFGTFGIIWLTLWYLFSSNNPESNKFINIDEKDYIQESLGKMPIKRKNIKTPWLKILTCVPFYAAMIAQLSFSFSVVLIQTYLPMFVKQVLRVNLKMNGLFSILPFIAQIITKNLLSNIADLLKKRKILRHTQSVKIFQLIGNIGCACCFLILAFFIDCDTIPLAALTLALFGCFVSCGIPGFFTALLSIAPIFTGTLTSISLTIGIIGHSASPMLVGIFNKNGTKEEWRIIWLVAFILHCISAIIFTLFGSADIQEWAKQKSDINENEKLKNDIKNDDNLEEVEMIDIPDNLSIAD